MSTPRQLQLDRMIGRADVVSAQNSNPPPEIQIDPRFEQAFPEQAANIRRGNEGLRQWWREFVIAQTKE